MKKPNVNENTLINVNTLEKENSLGKCTKKIRKGNGGITLIALVITVALNCSCVAMERMLKKELILKII